MRKPTAAQERTILRSAVKKTRADLEKAIIDGGRSNVSVAELWRIISSLSGVMDLCGIPPEQKRS